MDSHSSFIHHDLLISGTALDNALAIKRTLAADPKAQILSFDNRSGTQVDFDLRGSEQDIAARLAVGDETCETSANTPQKRGRGRPKLGVVAREVTLLPRHWDWLSAQPGGASVTLRKLVEEARRATSGTALKRQCQERVYNFISAIAGNLPGYEDATRALFQDDLTGLQTQIANWPAALRTHTLALLEPNQ